MVEMFIIGSAMALGNYMNGVDRKKVDEKVIVSGHNKPSGDLIYNSNRSIEIDAEMLERAKKKHPERVRRMFPEVPENAKNNVFPDSDFGGEIGAPVNFDTSKQQKYNPSNIVPEKDLNYNAYNPQTSKEFAFQTLNVDNSPMFRNDLNYSPASVDNNQGGSISLLSGKPLDMTHTNMQPFFSSKNKQSNLADDGNSQVRLERFTGVPSSNNMGTYSKKTERTGYMNQGDSFIKANSNQLPDRYSRAVDAVKPNNNLYTTPIQPKLVTPFDRDERVLPPGIDETRSKSNQKSTYSGVTVQGQKGSVRGLIAESRVLPKNNFVEYNPENYVGNRSELTNGATRSNPSVREYTSTNEYKSGYTGPSVYQSARNTKDIKSDKLKWKNSINNNVNKRLDTFKPHILAATGTTKPRQIGGFTIKEQQNERHLPKGQKYFSKGTIDRTMNPLRGTIKDATGINTIGAINPSSTFINESNYRFDQENWKRDLQVTHKELLIENKYIGQGHDNQGMGITQNTFEHYTTTKETNLHDNSQKGQTKGITLNHMSYDSVFETGENKTKETSRMGINTGPTNKQVIVPIPENDFNAPTKKDYMGIGSSYIPEGIDRDNFENSVDTYEGRPDFGNHYNAGKSLNKTRGADIKRIEKHEIKDNTTVKGRIQVGLGRDNPDKYLDTDVYLKETVNYPTDQELVNKIQPLGDRRLQPEVVIKDEYTQNNRLDSTIRISNDLYPWLKK
jgi:hypothetical protein